MARKSPHSPNEQLYRKRLAARLRQRKCRERKRLAALAKKEAEKRGASKVVIDDSNKPQKTSTHYERNENPAPLERKVHHAPHHPNPAPPSYVFRPVAPPPYSVHQHPPMGGRPSHKPANGMMPRYFYPYPPPRYYHHPGYHGPPMMSHPPHGPPTHYHPERPHHSAAPMSHNGISREAEIPRTVSRTSSIVSIDSDVYSKNEANRVVGTCPKSKPPQIKNALLTEEKTALAAILSLKTSSEEESCDETSSAADDSTINTAPSIITEESSTILPAANLNNAFSEASSGGSRPRQMAAV